MAEAEKSWEYHILVLTTAREIDQPKDALNGLGREGWELIAVDAVNEKSNAFFFKRPYRKTDARK